MTMMGDSQEDVVGVQQCNKCKRWLPLTEYTWRDKAHTERHHWCKPCMRDSTKASRQKKLKHYQDVNRAWNIAHKEQLDESRRRWMRENRDRHNTMRRIWYRENRAKFTHTPKPDAELDSAIQEWLSRHPDSGQS